MTPALGHPLSQYSRLCPMPLALVASTMGTLIALSLFCMVPCLHLNIVPTSVNPMKSRAARCSRIDGYTGAGTVPSTKISLYLTAVNGTGRDRTQPSKDGRQRPVYGCYGCHSFSDHRSAACAAVNIFSVALLGHPFPTHLSSGKLTLIDSIAEIRHPFGPRQHGIPCGIPA